MKRKLILVLFCLIISFGSVAGMMYLKKSIDDTSVGFKLVKQVKKGDLISESDLTAVNVPTNLYPDLIQKTDIKGKMYSTDLFKGDVLRRPHTVSPENSPSTAALKGNEGIIGVKTDLINSAGSILNVGDTVTVYGIRKENDLVVSEPIGTFEIVSIKNTNAIDLSDAAKVQTNNTLMTTIPAVVSLKVQDNYFDIFTKYDDFKLIKR